MGKGKESKKAEGDEGVEEERMEIMGLRRRDWGQDGMLTLRGEGGRLRLDRRRQTGGIFDCGFGTRKGTTLPLARASRLFC